MTSPLSDGGPVVLTGGTGFLGRWILAALRARGLAVRLVCRDPAAAADLAGDGVVAVRGDVTDRGSLAAALDGAGALLHASTALRRPWTLTRSKTVASFSHDDTAAAASSWEKDATVFERVNVHGLRNAVEAAHAAGVSRMLHVSSFFALGPTDGITGDETLPVDPDRDLHNDYERTKTLAEVEARELIGRGLPLVTVYPGLLFGPGELRESNFIGGLLVEAARGKLKGLPGGGAQRWCFTPVEDAGEGCVRALERGAPGDRFMLGGTNSTLRAFFDLVAERGGPGVPDRALPWSVLRAAGAASEWLAALGGPRPKVTRGAVAILEHDWAYTSRRAERALDWSARPLPEAVDGALAYLRSEGHLS